MLEIPKSLYRSLNLSIKGIIGSFLTSLCMRASRIIKFVAQVSSSNKSSLLSISIASEIAAAIDVEPDASLVEKCSVSFICGRLCRKFEISTLAMLLPSSLLTFTALSSVTTYSRPSPLM